ncbi:hypothetical protein BC834DRAFT_830222, partial [Gloeopeniophorella convolvens]
IKLHLISNVMIGEVETRQTTRIYFPKLYTREDRLRYVTQDQLKKLYDSCTCPAVIETIGAHASHWPPSYEAVMSMYRGSRGGLHPGSVAIPSDQLREFGSHFIEKLDQVPEFKGAFFVHEFRGYKGATAHQPTLADSLHAFGSFTRCLDHDRIDPEDWWVDVGLEVHQQGQILLWSRHDHNRLLEYIFPECSSNDIEKMQRSRAFKLDRKSGLDNFAGFHGEIGKGPRTDIVYANVYHTDKTPTYQLHKGVFWFRTGEDLYPSKIQQFLKDINTMTEIFIACVGDEDTGRPPQEGCT